MTDRELQQRFEPDVAVDAALRRLGGAQPPLGLETRVKARLAVQAHRQRSGFGAARLQIAGVMLGLVAALAVGLWSSRRTNPMATRNNTGSLVQPLPPNKAVPFSPRPGPRAGLATAAARRTPSEPLRANGRSRFVRHLGVGRAPIARGAHRPLGVAAPANPLPVR